MDGVNLQEIKNESLVNCKNMLKKVAGETFINCPEILLLNLSPNEIVFLDDEAFLSLDKIETLIRLSTTR